jgi:hypothetical protein
MIVRSISLIGISDPNRVDSMYAGVDVKALQAATLARHGVSLVPHREYMRYCLKGSGRVPHQPDSFYSSRLYMLQEGVLLE